MKNSTSNDTAREFHDENIMILEELIKYPQDDNKLLMLPRQNIGDPFFKFFLKNLGKGKNDLLIGINLLSFLHSTNRVLSKAYSFHSSIMENRDKTIPSSLHQLEIDRRVMKDSLIINEYKVALRNFISMLRIGIDQLILLLTNNYGNYKAVDCAGGFLEQAEKNNYNAKFLILLNAASNFLKHHPWQFEGLSMELTLIAPALPIIVDKDRKNDEKPYEWIIKYCGEKEYFIINNHLLKLHINCNFLVFGFNEFINRIKLEVN